MAQKWYDYYYCAECDRPLRLEETQKVSEDRTTKIECLVCNSKCVQPGSWWSVICGFLFVFLIWFMNPDRNIADPIGMLLVIGTIGTIVQRSGNFRRVKIYNSWIKKHGSDCRLWPTNKFKFDLWPDHVDHDPEATKTTLQTANCSACGKPCSDANVCVMSEGKPIHKTCLYSPHEL